LIVKKSYMIIFTENSNTNNPKIIRDENEKIIKTAEGILCEYVDNDGKYFIKNIVQLIMCTLSPMNIYCYIKNIKLFFPQEMLH